MNNKDIINKNKDKGNLKNNISKMIITITILRIKKNKNLIINIMKMKLCRDLVMMTTMKTLINS
jgi:hypothetical protein